MRGRTALLVALLVATGLVVAPTSMSRAASDATVRRLAGADRIETAIAISQEQFAGRAQGAVLARADDYADALTGGPLAANLGAPLLLTASTTLDPRVAAELSRIGEPGMPVYLLGGTAALAQAVDDGVRELGFEPRRVAGPERYSTALAVADLLDPQMLLVATGLNFPDALAASPAAIRGRGAVVLSAAADMPAPTANYIAGHASLPRYAIGGPAAAADPGAAPIAGADRYDTARRTAEVLFDRPSIVAVSSGTSFADALSGGVYAGRVGAPILLAPGDTLGGGQQDYIGSEGATVVGGLVFGGAAAVPETVSQELAAAIPAPSGLRVETPNGGESFDAEGTTTVEWVNDATPGSTVRIELLDRGNVTQVISDGAPIGDGLVSWRIPAAHGRDFLVRVITDAGTVDISDLPFALSDVRAPRVRSVVVTPNRVDTSATDRVVRVAIEIEDDLSGFKEGWGYFSGPSGQAIYFGFGDPIPVPLLRRKATYEVDVTLPRGAEEGRWLSHLGVSDWANNDAAVTGVGLQQAGMPSHIDQVGDGVDAQVFLDGVSVTPSSVNTASGDAEVAIDVVASAPAGVQQVQVYIAGPAGSWDADNAVLTDGVWSMRRRVAHHSPRGTWRIAMLRVVDGANNERWFSHHGLRTAGFDSGFEQSGTGDHTAPRVTALDITPSHTDSRAGAGVVTVRAEIADDRSGVGFGSVLAVFRSPSGQEVHATYVAASDHGEMSGTYVGEVTVPAFSELGTWKLEGFLVWDLAGNMTDLAYADLVDNGLDASFDNANATTPPAFDVDGPTASHFSITPTAVDVRTGAQSVTFEVAAEDPAGLDASVAVVGPNGVFRWNDLTRVSGTDQDGVWRGTMEIPAGSPSGLWRVVDLRLIDSKNNHRAITGGVLPTFGWPGTIVVTGPAGADAEAPIVRSFELNPTSVNTADAPQEVTFRLRATDATAVDRMSVSFVAVGSSVHPSTDLALVSGTPQDGIYEASVVLPQGSSAASWYVSGIHGSDTAGNSDGINADDIRMLGFPNDVTNDDVTAIDEDSPFLKSFDLSPGEVDTSESETVTFTLRASDPAGVSGVWVYIQTPTRRHVIGPQMELVSGTSKDGTWSGSITVPAGSETGLWRVGGIQLDDAQGNSMQVSAGDLDLRDFPNTFRAV